MSKELLAGIVNDQQMAIYAEETKKLQADYDQLKEKYDALYEDYIALKRDNGIPFTNTDNRSVQPPREGFL